jgi:hypothetical protein
VERAVIEPAKAYLYAADLQSVELQPMFSRSTK